MRRFPVLIGLCLLFGAVGCSRPEKVETNEESSVVETAEVAPEFTRVTEWIHGPALTMKQLRGKVVVIHFWTNGCINCIHNYPHYRAWQDRYEKKEDLVIVGIHTPEFEEEHDVARIKERAKKNGLKFAIAVDNDSANWRAWKNQYWPCIYLVDRTGKVRHRWEGELHEDGYRQMTDKIDQLLGERADRSRDR